MSICNRSRSIRVNSGEITISWRVSLLSGLGLVPGCDGRTDIRTDRITIASTRLALRAVARKNGCNIVQDEAYPIQASKFQAII